MIKLAEKLSIILISSITCGILLLLIVYSIPVSLMEQNGEISSFLLAIEGSYPVVSEYLLASKIDNWVNALMINTAIYDGPQGLLDKVLHAYTVRYPDENLIFALPHYFSIDNSGYIFESYTRYWHGYLVFLKPLLMLFNIEQIRLINLLLIILFAIITVYLFQKNHLSAYSIPYILSLLFLLPHILYRTMLYYGIVFLMQISMIIMLSKHFWLKQKQHYCYFFYIIGILACYIDILSFPLLSLGMPLTLYFVLTSHSKWKDAVKKCIQYGFLWSAGFVSMWGGKWVFASLYEGSFLPIQEAINSISERSGTADYFTGEQFSRLDAVWINIETAFIPFLYVFLIGCCYFVATYFIKRKFISFERNTSLMGFFLIFILPFLWYCMSANHSYLHAFYTFRILGMNVFVIFCAMLGCFKIESRHKLYDKTRKKH